MSDGPNKMSSVKIKNQRVFTLYNVWLTHMGPMPTRLHSPYGSHMGSPYGTHMGKSLCLSILSMSCSILYTWITSILSRLYSNKGNPNARRLAFHCMVCVYTTYKLCGTSLYVFNAPVNYSFSATLTKNDTKVFQMWEVKGHSGEWNATW